MNFTLDVRESLRIALTAIRANKARGALTTLGIIIGIVAVITTMTAANGLQNTFRQGLSADHAVCSHQTFATLSKLRGSVRES